MTIRCVVNIPEDVERVGPDPAEGEQMAVLAGGAGKLYGSKDESHGRVNPALEPDYDMEPGYNDKSVVGSPDDGVVDGGGGGGQLGLHGPNVPRQPQSSTAF